MDRSRSRFFALFGFCLLQMASAALCPEKCHCDVEALSYDCTNSDLEGIPIFLHPDTKVLKARNSEISKLEDNVNIYSQLEILDLSGNKFRHLGKNHFSNCLRLQQLNLSNNFVASVHPATFQGPEAMQELDLSRNTLTALTNLTLASLQTLVDLRLSHNKINAIEAAAFAGLHRLRVLYLDHNLIANINPSWFLPLNNLRFLYLDSNLLRTLPAFSFRPLKALRHLDLAANQIHNVSEEAFAGAGRSVDTLVLSRNLLNQVPNTALSSLKNLASLDLSHNPTEKLDRNSFSELYVLRTLKLEWMYHLSSVELHTFVDNMQLGSLDLSNNVYLQPLPWGVFSANSALSQLSFANNTLWTSLSPHQVPLRSIKSLSLTGIPFYCNCSLTWLWELYQHQNSSQAASKQFQLDEAVCESISNAAGSQIPLKNVKVDDLACANWTFVLLVASISILVTVTLLVLVALMAYKCRQRYLTYGPGTPCLHIKDDTMVYQTRIANGANFHQNPLNDVQVGETESSTYAKAILGGYSPPGSGTGLSYGSSGGPEPLYYEPRFNSTSHAVYNGDLPPGMEMAPSDGGVLYQPIPVGPIPNNTSSSDQSSKYSSSGYVGSELWENDFLGLNQVHVSYATQQRSPRSSSGLGSSTHSGSSTASSSGNKPVFFSPVRNVGMTNSHLHHTLHPVSSATPITSGGLTSGLVTTSGHMTSGSNSVHNSPAKFYHHPMYLNKFMSQQQQQQQHPLVLSNGTSIRSPKGQKRSNVYV